MTERTYSITALARELALTPRAIRHYEEQGLLKPRREGYIRIFTARDRARLKLVVRSSKLGFSLFDIRDLFELFERSGEDPATAIAFRDKLQGWRDILRRQRAEIDLLLGEIDFFDRQCGGKTPTA